jgi:hypothetical protein
MTLDAGRYNIHRRSVMAGWAAYLSHKEGGGGMALTSSLAGRNLGMLLLGVWLILTGLLPLLNMRLSSTVTTGLAVLGIAAGVLILLRR